MTETPGQAFRRVRKQRRDKMLWMAKELRTSTSMINYVERDIRRIPQWWLLYLPAEYAEAIVPIRIAEWEALMQKTKKPRPGGLTGTSTCSRTLGEVTQANGDTNSNQKSTNGPRTVPDPSPCSMGAPWGCGIYGESPEARAFRRYPVGYKP